MGALPLFITEKLRVTSARLTLYIVTLLFLGYLFPSELAFKLGIVVTVHKITLLLCFILTLIVAPRKFLEKTYVFCVSDFFVVALFFWCPFALLMSGGFKAMATSLSMTGVELFFSYIVGRFLLANLPALRISADVILIMMIVLLCLGFIDLIAGENIIARVASGISGNFRSVKYYGNDSDAVLAYTTQYRFGLPRVRGPIEHSILYGGFFTMVAPLLFYLLQGAFKKILTLGVCGLGVLLSISSAPILCYALFLMVIFYDSLFCNVRWRWTLLFVLAAALVVSLIAIVDNPIEALISGFTLDPQTGFTRILIWYWVGKNLSISPIFGVGDSDWTRRSDMLSSIDCLWLNHTLEYGYVGMAILAMIIVGAFFVWTPRRLPFYPNPAYGSAIIACNISILIMILIAFTCDIWGSTWSLVGMILGVRASLSESIYLPPEKRGGI